MLLRSSINILNIKPNIVSVSRSQFYKCWKSTNITIEDKFEKVLGKKEVVGVVLQKYIEIGKKIQKYKTPMFKDLEDLILNYDSSKVVKKSLETFRDCSGTGNFFIALAAPSMTGKTQLAFSITSKLPLYFVFSSSQAIYESFDDLSDNLLTLAAKDVKKLKNKKQPITLTSLKKNRMEEFESLGLLIELMERAFEKFGHSSHPSIEEWMEHFSNLQIKPQSKIRAVSVYEFQRHPFAKEFTSKFYVFLDEFCFEPGVILLRNICRYIGLTCTIASTNASIVNSIGVKSRSGSRGESPSLWTMVFPHLPQIPKEMIEDSSFEFNEKLEKLIKHVESSGTMMMSQRMKLLSKYISEQYLSARPGVSKLISESLDDSYKFSVDKAQSFDVDEFFTAFMEELSQKVAARKETFCTDIDGMRSNVKLMIGNSFDNNYKLDGPLIKNDQMLDKHFFYLKNPYGRDNGPFSLYRMHKRLSPHICFGSKSRVYSPQCFFDANEQLLLLACALKEMSYSTSKLFSDETVKEALGDSSNTNAPSLSGNELETMACAAIIESSHYTDTDRDCFLQGVSLNNFFSNFLSNFNMKCEQPRSQRVPVKIEFGSDLATFMNSVRVPFLFPANVKIPVEFKEIFPLQHSSLRFGEYYRPSNNQQVDASFDVFDDTTPQGLTVVECKNRFDNLSPMTLKTNLEKALLFSKMYHSSKSLLLQLSICRNLVSANDLRTNWGVLSSFVREARVNIYCLKASLDGKGFVFIPLSQIHPGDFELYPDPEFISIVLETDLILKYFDDK